MFWSFGCFSNAILGERLGFGETTCVSGTTDLLILREPFNGDGESEALFECIRTEFHTVGPIFWSVVLRDKNSIKRQCEEYNWALINDGHTTTFSPAQMLCMQNNPHLDFIQYLISINPEPFRKSRKY